MFGKADAIHELEDRWRTPTQAVPAAKNPLPARAQNPLLEPVSCKWGSVFNSLLYNSYWQTEGIGACSQHCFSLSGPLQNPNLRARDDIQCVWVCGSLHNRVGWMLRCKPLNISEVEIVKPLQCVSCPQLFQRLMHRVEVASAL